MSRLAFGGFEGRHPSADGFSTSGGIASTVIDTLVPRSGDACLKCPGGAGSVSIAIPSPTSGRTYHPRIWIRLSANPGATLTIMRLATTVSLGANTVNVQIDTSGRLIGADGTTSSPLALNTWHCVEMEYVANGTNIVRTHRLNGTNVGSSSTTAYTVTPSFMGFGIIAGSVSIDLYLDDWAINDDQGSNNTSWCGVDGLIRALKPTADSAIGSAWTLGNGGAPGGNAFQAVNDTPPTGVADGSATSTSQIKDATSTITNPVADADFTMESYTAAGLGAGDTVIATQAKAIVGQAATTVRSMAARIVSNPADGADGTLNTLSAAIGTYPSNWTVVPGPVTDNPSVTLGTAPVARVGKRAANAAVVHACSLLVHVEYTQGFSGALTGSASGSASGSGTLARALALIGSDSASGSGSGTLARALALIGAASAVGSGSGSLANTHLVGSASAVASGAGTLSLARALTGSSSAIGSATGSLSGLLALMGGASTALAEAWGFLGLELPTRITGDFTDRWASGLHVGEAKPGLRVEVRAGRFNRRYAPWFDAGFPVDAVIGDSAPAKPWQAFWEPTEAYKEIPSVRSVELGKTVDEKGIASATIVVDNIAYIAEDEGYHSIHRGFMAPLRGYVADGRTQLVDERGDLVAENEWARKLNRKRQITVHESYGDAEVKTFTGLIDDVDTTSNPAVITITARAVGQVLSDEEFVGWNIDKDLRDPVVFIDKDEADKINKGGYDPEASSTGGSSFGVENVNDGDSDTYWRSNDHTGPGNTEWVEIRVSEGRHEDFWLGAEYPDLDVYISIFAKPLADGSAPKRDGIAITPNAWVDVGLGNVPGTFGGEPYVRLISHPTSAQVLVRDLDASYLMGDDSIIRVSFRNLYDLGGGTYRAAVRSLYARKRTLVDEPGATKWIRVGDLSDVVKVVLRWAGFKEWEVESTGARLGKRLLVNRGMKYMDLIDKIKDVVGYDFFLADPTSADESIGVPVFRKSHVVAEGIDPLFTVTDGSDAGDGKPHLLTAVDVKETDEPLGYIIRARGRTSKTGDTFGGDTTRRIMYVYRPPWSGLDSAGIIRHVVHTDQLYTTADDVRFAAWYTALEEALASVAVGVQIPAYPGIDLDDIFVLEDLGTGLTTRLVVRERRSTHVAGEDADWTMTLSGAITDTPDVQEIVELIGASRRDA